MTQLFKTENSGTISQYVTCYCNSIITMPIHERQGFVQRLTVQISCLTLTYNGSNNTLLLVN